MSTLREKFLNVYLLSVLSRFALTHLIPGALSGEKQKIHKQKERILHGKY